MGPGAADTGRAVEIKGAVTRARLNDLIETRDTARLLFIGDEPKEIIRAYLHGNGVATENIYTLRTLDPKLGVTPTLLVVQAKKVTHAWVGQLSQSAEGDVTKALEVN